jgi:hypothetical protein
MRNHKTAVTALLLAALAGSSAASSENTAPNPLTGTWTLVSADVIRPDGVRARDYGPAPAGLLIVDSRGKYSLQIFDTTRTRFASGDKLKGAPAEYEAAVRGSSTHFGTMTVDTATRTMTLDIEASSFPNQEKTKQKRQYELDGGTLSYRVAPRPDGSVPISVWRRVE